MSDKILKKMADRIVGQEVAHIWRGRGSALFLEVGALSPTKRRDGSAGEPEGEFGVMIEWSWRIDGRKSIICGSWSDQEDWPKGFSVILGQKIVGISLIGKLPEVQIDFSNGATCTSFMTTKGQPKWAIFDRTSSEIEAIHSRYGRVQFE